MKTRILTLTIILLSAIAGHAQIKVLTTGEVNIGKTTGYTYLKTNYTGYNGTGLVIFPTDNCITYLGKVGNGFNTVYTVYTQNPSDARAKENVKSVSNAVNIIKQLNGVYFDYKASFYKTSENMNNNAKSRIEKERKNHIGFLAQDVQKVLPQVVFHDDSLDFYTMDYTKLIPILVEAIKEQQSMIEELASKQNNAIASKKEGVTTGFTTEASYVASLEQNSPNPFNQSTEIVYYLPETVQNAMLNVYDMNGLQIRSFSHLQTGKGSITVHAAELKPGIYLYSLIADGKEIDTKRMILTE